MAVDEPDLLGITSKPRHRFATTMSLAADDAGLPDDPEFRAALMGYVEWGTRLAMHNSRPGRATWSRTPRSPGGAGASRRRTRAEALRTPAQASSVSRSTS